VLSCFSPSASTSGGAPFGPRVEIVDGELVFPDEPPPDVDSKLGPEDEDSSDCDPPPPHPRQPLLSGDRPHCAPGVVR
jgi:hypothetical protein